MSKKEENLSVKFCRSTVSDMSTGTNVESYVESDGATTSPQRKRIRQQATVSNFLVPMMMNDDDGKKQSFVVSLKKKSFCFGRVSLVGGA